MMRLTAIALAFVPALTHAGLIDVVSSDRAGDGPTYAAIARGGTANDGQTTILYSSTTGEVSVDAPAGKQLTSINIESAACIFTGAPAENLGGSFDNDTDCNIFKATFGSSFGSLSFGPVAQPGLGCQFVRNDLTVVGSLAGGGDLGMVDLGLCPEPATIVLTLAGLLCLIATRRRIEQSRHGRSET